jgi:hypothetical protein
MKSTIIFVFLILPLVISGQGVVGPTGYSETDMNSLNPNRLLIRTKSADAYGTIGTPYVFKDFKKGNLYYSNQQRVSNILLNYDCYNNQLVYTSGGSRYLLNSDRIEYFESDPGQDSSRLFRQVFVEDLKKRVFLQVLYNDASILYKRYYKDFREADYGGAYSQDNRYDEYHDRQAYYIKLADGDLQQLKPRKKSILEVLSDRSDEIEKYIKKEKPDLKTDAGLVRLIGFYDGLQ